MEKPPTYTEYSLRQRGIKYVATVFLLHTYMKKARNNHCHIVTKHVIVGWAMIVKRPVQNAKIWRDEGLQVRCARVLAGRRF